MKNFKKTKGFTLIELLVVISIIAVLMSILMPALTKVREQAKKTLCSSNQRSMSLALNAYADASNGVYPVPHEDIDEDGNAWEAGDDWVYTLEDNGYLGGEIDNLRYSKGIWSCPSSERAEISNADAIKPGHGIAIGMNDGTSNIDEPDMPMVRWPASSFYSKPIKIAKIENPGNTVIMADIQSTWSIYTWRWANNMPVPNDNNCYTLRHSGGSNFSFVDGHIEFAEPEEEQIEYGICRPARFKYHFYNY
ncbi:MAG: prepilin-type N-terminal cleavage/methylation domain-containing protein [Sedimentisphaeraceae bacterium JB056]